jgi:hypothetical protein
MNITIAKSWNELNDWPINEIAHLYLNANPENFADAYLKMIFIVFQKSNSLKSRLFLKKILRQIPVSELEKHTDFLLNKTDFYKFPEISGLIKPADRLRNITIFHFSAVDMFFHAWFQEKSLLNLKRFVASLYRINRVKSDDLEAQYLAIHDAEKLAIKILSRIKYDNFQRENFLYNAFLKDSVEISPVELSGNEFGVEVTFSLKNKQLLSVSPEDLKDVESVCG